MSGLSSQVAVVTGAGRGIGRAIAHALALRGETVIAVARTMKDLEETLSGATGPGRVIPRRVDVARSGEVEELFGDIAKTYDGVSSLVCSHGIYQGGVTALMMSLGQFDETLRVNLRGSFHCAQLAARSMRHHSRAGRIVFISSMNGLASQTGALDYDVSKAAVNGLTRALAVELAPFQITVNAIAPGWVRTPMSTDELRELDEHGMVMNPLHRAGEPAEIALAVLWLTDPANGYTTGAVIPIDGGQLAMLPMPWAADHPIVS